MNAPAWVGITYLIYCVCLYTLTLGGAGYAVFVLGYNGWWILAAFLICCGGCKPHHWNALFTGKYEEKSEGE